MVAVTAPWVQTIGIVEVRLELSSARVYQSRLYGETILSNKDESHNELTDTGFAVPERLGARVLVTAVKL